jgi:hypothetical protein
MARGQEIPEEIHSVLNAVQPRLAVDGFTSNALENHTQGRITSTVAYMPRKQPRNESPALQLVSIDTKTEADYIKPVLIRH